MKFKEYAAWCNARAADGCWSMSVASFCIEIYNKVKAVPFWKREKAWQEIAAENDVIRVVEDINQLIERYKIQMR